MTHRTATVTPAFKVWLRKGERDVLGEGGASLLEAIDRYGSITKAAERTGLSYKYAWDRLADVQAAVGHPILRTKRGGRTGGGGAELTETARTLLRKYRRLKQEVEKVVADSGLRFSV